MSLALTENAVEAVKGIVGSAIYASDTVGVRIVANESDARRATFQLRVVAGPTAGDEMIETGGARVFLSDDTAALLQEKTLDAEFVDEDNVAFTITENG